MNRPRSIQRFAALYSLCIVTGTALGLRGTFDGLRIFEPYTVRWVGGLTAGFIASGLLVYFIANRRSKIARWLVLLQLVGVGVGIAIGAWDAIATSDPQPFSHPPLEPPKLVVIAVRAYAVWLLFRPDSKAWFKGMWPPPDVARVFE